MSIDSVPFVRTLIKVKKGYEELSVQLETENNPEDMEVVEEWRKEAVKSKEFNNNPNSSAIMSMGIIIKGM